LDGVMDKLMVTPEATWDQEKTEVKKAYEEAKRAVQDASQQLNQ